MKYHEDIHGKAPGSTRPEAIPRKERLRASPAVSGKFRLAMLLITGILFFGIQRLYGDPALAVNPPDRLSFLSPILLPIALCFVFYAYCGVFKGAMAAYPRARATWEKGL